MAYTTVLLNAADNAHTTISHTGGYAAGATSIVVASALGFPSAPFAVALGADTANYEEVIVTNVTGSTFTLLAATVNVHPDGDAAEGTLGAEYVTRLNGFATGHTHTGTATDGAVVPPLTTAWTDWTPTLTETGSVTFTTQMCRYKIIDTKTALVQLLLNITSAGTANSPVQVGSVPAAITPKWISAGSAIITVGTFIYQDASPFAWYVGLVYVVGVATLGMVVHNAAGVLGSVPNFATASGDSLSINAQWEIA